MKNAICSLLLLAMVICTITVTPIQAVTENSSTYEKAVDLKVLGLWVNNIEIKLGQTPSKVEGVCMLVELLGKDQEISKLKYTHPFTDVPSWAEKHVGFIYKNGLESGISGSLFGSTKPLTAVQYLGYILKALGYDDKNGDFNTDNIFEKSVQTGLLNSTEAVTLKNKSTFLRDDLIELSYKALKIKLKSSNMTLLDKLITQDKTVYKEAATLLGLYTSDLQNEIGNIMDYEPVLTSMGYVANNSDDLFRIMRKEINEYKTTINIDYSKYQGDALKDFEAAYKRAYNAVNKSTGVSDFISSWKYSSQNCLLNITINYRFPLSEFQIKKKRVAETINKARHIVADIIKPGMSDYDKELVLHNYIVKNTKYDYNNFISGNIPESDFDAYGNLVLGKSVCQGYSTTMKLLCDLAAVECIIVSGETKNTSKWLSHSWNIVKINGDYYHVDVTSDDPVMKSGKETLTYYYFNLPDAELSKHYRWDKSGYPACKSVAYNYYYKNGLVVNNIKEYTNALMSAVKKREPKIELKVKDYTDSVYSDPTTIMFKTNDVSTFNYSINNRLGIISITEIKYRS
jgi:Uncharacterized protein involved in cytokinesis, contains TGc (transglutaminase/protease-like) domain